MPLPAPKLDDRDFQDLVDDAKRYIQERCPEWTDHNVSDPGVTLIETFAWMTDLMLYRMNRVPDRVYSKFLELLGIERHPPTAAYADVDFRLSAPQDSPVLVPAGTVVSTPRTPSDPAVAFTTTADLTIGVGDLRLVANRIGNQRKIRDITATLDMGSAIPIFSDEPENEDALYLGLANPLPNHLVVIDFDAELGGHGIDPRRPPLRWEAWDGTDWVRCDVLRDETGGLNLDGRVELELPPGHQLADIDDHRYAWIRCRVAATATRPPYRSSPMVASIAVYSVGATTEAVNAEFISGEPLGLSSGVAGQEFHLRHAPVVPSDEPFAILVSRSDLDLRTEGGDADAVADETGYEVWQIVADFAGSGPDDRHFVLDAHNGVVKFGPMIREPDGSTRRHGAIPAKGATIVAPRYRTGGGAQGNVSPHAISVLRTSVPMVAGVDNRRPALGGVDAETVDEAKERGPIELRVRNRAVTIEDFEYLAKKAAPNLARVQALLDQDDAGPAVRVLLVPTVGDPDDPIELRDLYPPEALRDRVAQHLDERRLIGTRVIVTPPTYLGLRVRAQLAALPDANPIEVESACNSQLRRYFHPVHGGRDGRGWPFGRSVSAGEVYSVLQQVRGVDIVRRVELLAVNPETGDEENVGDMLELFETDLLLPVDHDITVEG